MHSYRAGLNAELTPIDGGVLYVVSIHAPVKRATIGQFEILIRVSIHARSRGDQSAITGHRTVDGFNPRSCASWPGDTDPGGQSMQQKTKQITSWCWSQAKTDPRARARLEPGHAAVGAELPPAELIVMRRLNALPLEAGFAGSRRGVALRDNERLVPEGAKIW